MDERRLRRLLQLNRGPDLDRGRRSTNPAVSHEARRITRAIDDAIVAAALPPVCQPGTHAFGEIAGTYRGETVARRVVCSNCRRTFEQVLEEQPEELARFQAWLEAGQPE